MSGDRLIPWVSKTITSRTAVCSNHSEISFLRSTQTATMHRRAGRGKQKRNKTAACRQITLIIALAAAAFLFFLDAGAVAANGTATATTTPQGAPQSASLARKYIYYYHPAC